jgi:hypothetical protein
MNGDNKTRRLIWHGIFLFMLGLLTGVAIPALTNPRMGVSAHLEGVLNGIFSHRARTYLARTSSHAERGYCNVQDCALWHLRELGCNVGGRDSRHEQTDSASWSRSQRRVLAGSHRRFRTGFAGAGDADLLPVRAVGLARRSQLKRINLEHI